MVPSFTLGKLNIATFLVAVLALSLCALLLWLLPSERRWQAALWGWFPGVAVWAVNDAHVDTLGVLLVVGGLGTVTGPIVGTVIMAFVQARLQSWPDVRLIVLGLILLVMIVAVPRGIVAFAGGYRRRLDDWIDEDTDEDTDEDEAPDAPGAPPPPR